MTSEAVQPKKAPLAQWVGLVAVYLLIPLILLGVGGDWGWWQAWIYSAVLVAAGVLGRMEAEKRHPGLMAERTSLDKAASIKPWDKVLSPLMSLSVGFPLHIVAALDHRNGWSAALPLWLNLLGLVLCTAGYAFAIWALVENRFFSSVVRIQADRGHTVCDSGPYRFVRHPGYIGNILPLPGIVLALSSLWTILPAAFALVVIILRTVLEDRTLQAKLPGYKEYAGRVRYRLVPGVF